MIARHQVAVAARRSPRARSIAAAQAAGVALGADPPDAARPGAAPPPGRSAGSAACATVVVAEAVDADDDLVARLDRPLDAVGRLLDLALLEAAPRSRRACRPSPRSRRGTPSAAASSSLVRRLDVVRAGERVGRLGHAGLVGEDLLGPEGEPGRLLGRQRERLVARVRVQALGAAEDRGERLDRGPDDVVVDRLGGQARAGGLDVEAAHHRARVRRAEALAHDPSPTSGGRPGTWRPPRTARVQAAKKNDRRPAKSSTSSPRATRRLDVGDRVGQGEGELLGGRRPGLAHVVADDRDRVPAAAARAAQNSKTSVTRRIDGRGG